MARTSANDIGPFSTNSLISMVDPVEQNYVNKFCVADLQMKTYCTYVVAEIHKDIWFASRTTVRYIIIKLYTTVNCLFLIC
jgi:hypothetical protein